MRSPASRRDFLRSSAAAGLLAGASPGRAGAGAGVVVWDERQPAQRKAYANFLGNAIADHLRSQDGLSVRSVGLDDPGQGLGAGLLDDARVLIWWGHIRQAEVAPEIGRRIVARIKAGQLSLIALHSAHWSTPFMEAMNERTRLDVAKATPAGPAVEVREVPPPRRNTLPKADSRVTPYVEPRKFPDGRVRIDVNLPYCCFPSYRTDGKPSYVNVLRPEHPIMAGVPARFELPQEEMYDEPFHVPEPDAVLLEERWPAGEWFRSGMLWKLGAGHVFYLRPGHETYPVYKQPVPLQIVANAVRWLSSGPS